MARYLIGIDEVGRGPLAGPITVGAVASSADLRFKIYAARLLKGIKDSKKLSVSQREEWLDKLKQHNLKYKSFKFATSSVGSKIIDRIGIANAARLAVGRCLKKLSKQSVLNAKNHKILLDGSLYAPKTYLNQETIIRGDEKIPIIAAASIFAKVHRDKKMRKLHEKYPEYGFDRHKGYGTAYHTNAIKKHGLSPLHRKSFCKNFV